MCATAYSIPLANRAKTEIKVILVGNKGVGKTSILDLYTNERVDPSVVQTFGYDVFEKVVSREVDVDYTLQIWDTAGREKNGQLDESYYRDADGCVLMFATDAAHTFFDALEWHDEVLSHVDKSLADNFPIIFVGNKADIYTDHQRDMWSDALRVWRHQNRCTFFETSVIDVDSVNDVFNEVAIQGIYFKRVRELDVSLRY